jgi:hypothetical protein
MTITPKFLCQDQTFDRSRDTRIGSADDGNMPAAIILGLLAELLVAVGAFAAWALYKLWQVLFILRAGGLL